MVPRPQFELGHVVATEGASEALARNGSTATATWLLYRHSTGDWGEVDGEDRKINDQALIDGGRLFSVYKLDDGTTLWVITEEYRSVTTFILPSDY
jgi:hypothetical protein